MNNTMKRRKYLRVLCGALLASFAATGLHAAASASASKVVFPKKGETSVQGDWKLKISIRNKGTKSEGTSGELFYKDKPVKTSGINDAVETPWGVLYWHGEDLHDKLAQWQHWGWSIAARKGFPAGKKLATS